MALSISSLPRQFKFKKDGKLVTLADPGNTFTAEDVIQFYSGQHPELTTCTIDGPRIEDGKAIYEFKTTVGTKG